jgi:hypothetical protein
MFPTDTANALKRREYREEGERERERERGSGREALQWIAGVAGVATGRSGADLLCTHLCGADPLCITQISPPDATDWQIPAPCWVPFHPLCGCLWRFPLAISVYGPLSTRSRQREPGGRSRPRPRSACMTGSTLHGQRCTVNAARSTLLTTPGGDCITVSPVWQEHTHTHTHTWDGPVVGAIKIERTAAVQ